MTGAAIQIDQIDQIDVQIDQVELSFLVVLPYADPVPMVLPYVDRMAESRRLYSRPVY